MILFNDSLIEIKKFPNGEAIIEKSDIADHVDDGGKNVITLKYESDADLFDLLLVKKATWFPVDLKLPYMPYSRMDRKSDNYVFTLKSVCKFINWLDFRKVRLYEPHSDVTPALLQKCVVFDLIPELLKKTDFNRLEDCVLYPDANAYKKYSDLLKIEKELVGFKKRDFTTGKITSSKVFHFDDYLFNDGLIGHKVYIIDDLCSKGGTFVQAAEQLKEMGAGEINLVVAHCETNIFNGVIFDTELIKKVYTTNTIIGKQFATDRLIIFDY